ncbi:MAG: glycosyltransferase [Candidatus Omnitrophota bacterium]
MEKIVVTYASAGAGHLKAAEALERYLKENNPLVKTALVDVLNKTNFLYKAGYTYGYSLLVKYAPWFWGLLFWVTASRLLGPIIRPLALLLNRVNAKEFIDFLLREKPDYVLSTHFLPSEIAAYLKRGNRLSAKLITIITDFGVHPFWICPGTDIYITASEVTKRSLAAKGVKGGSILALGIPVDEKFSIGYDRDNLCRKLNISCDKFTVLIATGSFGIGNIAEITGLLCKEAQVLVVCANNKNLYAYLKKEGYPNVSVFGFVDNVQELMAVSDVIIAKPGGMTISEALAMDLAPIFITSIPGQETENSRVLSFYGIGDTIDNPALIKEKILYFRDNPLRLKMIKENIRKIKKPNAAGDICYMLK